MEFSVKTSRGAEKKRKRESASEGAGECCSSPVLDPAAKKGRATGEASSSYGPPPQTGGVIYVCGRSSNLTLARPDEVKKDLQDQFGPVAKIERAGKCLKITCASAQHKRLKLSGGRVVANLQVVFSEPRISSSRSRLTAPTHERKLPVVASKVPQGITDGEMLAAIKALEAARIKKRVRGELVPTMAVLLTYAAGVEAPTHVDFEYLRFKIRPYIAALIRCFKCQAFGHTSLTCRKEVKCPVCAGKHEFAACTDTSVHKCANCGEGHSAAYRGCMAFERVQQTLKVVALERTSYKSALLNVTANITSATNAEVDGRGAPAPGRSNHATDAHRSACRPVVKTDPDDAAESRAVPDVTPAVVAVQRNEAPPAEVMGVIAREEVIESQQRTPVSDSDKNSTISPSNNNSNSRTVSVLSFCRFFTKFFELIQTCSDKGALGRAALAAAIEVLGDSVDGECLLALSSALTVCN